MSLPATTHLHIEREASVLHVTLNRPEARNAFNTAMLDDVVRLFQAIRDDRTIRTVLMRGAGGFFSAGADLKEVAQTRASDNKREAMLQFNRRFGALVRQVESAPQAVVMVVEGAALGGGFGLACVSDIAIIHADTKMGMPETRRGLPPAQIAPFVVNRIGLTAARKIAVCGDMFDGAEAVRLGVGQYLARSDADLEQHLDDVLQRIRRSAPGALAATKAIMQRVGKIDMDQLLDEAAEAFTDCALGEEGAEGTQAFIDKRPPAWEQQ
ncbi:MAG TPA: enoyl-CoA hydratase-related protein [Salinisphaeraceae bacterium]|nr:enoyl-CoA hydratase-related protein [Salinisphaeraceae bacterium]